MKICVFVVRKQTLQLTIRDMDSSYWLKDILKLDQLIELNLSDSFNPIQIILDNHLIKNMRIGHKLQTNQKI